MRARREHSIIRQRIGLPNILNGEEVLERQMTPRASGMREPQGFGPDHMARPFAGGTSPLKTEFPIYEHDRGRLAAWAKDGYLELSDEPQDGQIYGRQNGKWVVVTGGIAAMARWDQPGLKWDAPGIGWDRAAPLISQVEELTVRIAELEARLRKD